MTILNRFGSLWKRVRSGTSVDPVRDWLIVLTLGTLALISIITWNVWAFDTVANGGVIGTPAAAPQVLFNQSSLDAIRAIFDNRAAEEARYVNGTYRFTDPSL